MGKTHESGRLWKCACNDSARPSLTAAAPTPTRSPSTAFSDILPPSHSPSFSLLPPIPPLPLIAPSLFLSRSTTNSHAASFTRASWKLPSRILPPRTRPSPTRPSISASIDSAPGASPRATAAPLPPLLPPLGSQPFPAPAFLPLLLRGHRAPSAAGNPLPALRCVQLPPPPKPPPRLPPKVLFVLVLFVDLGLRFGLRLGLGLQTELRRELWLGPRLGVGLGRGLKLGQGLRRGSSGWRKGEERGEGNEGGTVATPGLTLGKYDSSGKAGELSPTLGLLPGVTSHWQLAHVGQSAERARKSHGVVAKAGAAVVVAPPRGAIDWGTSDI
ncbi:unnamed protein product [Closterium sp. NIES-54]